MTRYKVFDTISRLIDENDGDHYYIYVKGHPKPVAVGGFTGYEARTEQDALDIIDVDAGTLVGTFDYDSILAITNYKIFID